ncbi:MAG: hypothetical protein N3A61_04960, partial [Ignavibacteria bacterium]|nr:hypothetical protein [Ignavibacteria bacterium]
MKIILFILIINFSLIAQVRNDSTLNKLEREITRGIDLIYNIKFDSAEVIFKNIMAEYPENPAGRFFLAMVEWWRILLEINDESRDQHFYEMLEDVIYHCDEILKKNKQDVNAIFFKGGSIGFRGRLRAYRDSWIKAADDGREALPLVRLAHSIDPHNKDVYLGLGIYNYYASVVPDRFPYLKPLMVFFPSGDKNKGIEQLEETWKKGKYASTEA